MTVNFINYSETWLLVPVYLSVWIYICFVFICFRKECKFWRKLPLKMHVDSKTIYPIDIHVIKVQITSVLFRLYNTINTIILGENTIKVTHSCFFFTISLRCSIFWDEREWARLHGTIILYLFSDSIFYLFLFLFLHFSWFAWLTPWYTWLTWLALWFTWLAH